MTNFMNYCNILTTVSQQNQLVNLIINARNRIESAHCIGITSCGALMRNIKGTTLHSETTNFPTGKFRFWLKGGFFCIHFNSTFISIPLFHCFCQCISLFFFSCNVQVHEFRYPGNTISSSYFENIHYMSLSLKKKTEYPFSQNRIPKTLGPLVNMIQINVVVVILNLFTKKTICRKISFFNKYFSSHVYIHTHIKYLTVQSRLKSTYWKRTQNRTEGKRPLVLHENTEKEPSKIKVHPPPCVQQTDGRIVDC